MWKPSKSTNIFICTHGGSLVPITTRLNSKVFEFLYNNWKYLYSTKCWEISVGQSNFIISYSLRRCVKKFQKYPPCRLQDISIWMDKNSFFSPAKIRQLSSQGHICIFFKCSKWWCFFGFILQSKLATCLKIFKSFGIV